MATFKFGRTINIHWNGYDIVGPAETVFSIPDQLYEEFNADIAPVEPTLQWIDTNEFDTLSSLNNKVYYQPTEPTGTTLTIGDLWVDSDAGLVPNVFSLVGTSPISYSLATNGIGTFSILPATTTSSGAVQLTNSISSTSNSTAATPNSVTTANEKNASLILMLMGA